MFFSIFVLATFQTLLLKEGRFYFILFNVYGMRCTEVLSIHTLGNITSIYILNPLSFETQTARSSQVGERSKNAVLKMHGDRYRTINTAMKTER